MDSSVPPKDEIWFVRVCHHISNAVYKLLNRHSVEYQQVGARQFTLQPSRDYKLLLVGSNSTLVPLRYSAGNNHWVILLCTPKINPVSAKSLKTKERNNSGFYADFMWA